LPTGSGKTLVGLLVGEWRRRRCRQKAAYFCPTVQLANQVVSQAREYGIRAVALTGKKRKYPQLESREYLNAEVLAVTTYSSLFNVKSFFDGAETMVFDDAHAAENYVASHWSLVVRRSDHAAMFGALAGFVKPLVDEADHARLAGTGDEVWDRTWVEEIPAPLLAGHVAELVALLDEHARYDDDLGFRWSVLRDHVRACHLYVSAGAMLLRPLVPPTESHRPFISAQQRVYMSATLGSGGELERLWGRPSIRRLKIPEGWDKQGIGRRLFFFPELARDEDASKKLVLDMIANAPRALVLVPDDETEAEYCKTVAEKLKYRVFTADDIESSKTAFVSTDKAVTVAANRYDGIDLREDECRLLVVDGLPQARNLQERFLINRMGSGAILQDRVLTRVTQAVGRCTRSATDYAAVVVLGDDLNNYLARGENRRLLPPELQAEIDFGFQQAKDPDPTSHLENLRIFLEHGEAWNAVDQEIVELRNSLTQEPLPAADQIAKAVEHEVKFQLRLWQGDYGAALDEARVVLANLGGPVLAGYRAYWNYLAGTAAWLASDGGGPLAQVSREHFDRAASATVGVRWFGKLRRIGLTAAAEPDAGEMAQARLATVINGLEVQLQAIGRATARKFDAEERFIRENLAKNDANGFESAHEHLGKLLGYDAGRAPGEDGAPDPWWAAGDTLCIVFEDHTDAKPDAAAGLGANKVRQAASHPNWIREHTRYKHGDIVAVVVTPRTLLMEGAKPHANEVCYWNMHEFRKWAGEVLAVVRELWGKFPGPGDIAWRAEAMTAYRAAALDPDGLVQRLQSKMLRDLPTTKRRSREDA
jgi:RAD3-like DEAD/DEAH box helicase